MDSGQWTLTALQKDSSKIDCKWVFKFKLDQNGALSPLGSVMCGCVCVNKYANTEFTAFRIFYKCSVQVISTDWLALLK